MSKMIHPVILCGGSGTRLWPLSRAGLPKQFHCLSGSDSLLQGTVARLNDPGCCGAPVVICNDQHRHLVAEQLRQIEVEPERIVLEPMGRNTAPAAAVAAILLGNSNPDALLLLLPSDHFIADRPGFLRAVDQAAAAAAEDWLVTFGVQPDAPETGYGYIKRGGALGALDNCFQVDRFVEKPDLATAESYLQAGDFAWNSGMFLFSAKSLLTELERWQPEILAACRRAVESGHQEGKSLFLDRQSFSDCPSDSIDYAVMEKTERAAIVPVDIGWTDIGSWGALWEFSEKTEAGNVCHGDVIAVATQDSYLRSESRCLATVGAKDLVVVVTDDAVLVADRHQTQDVKAVVDHLKAQGRKEHLDHRKSHHEWGRMICEDDAFDHAVVHLQIDVGARVDLESSEYDSLIMILAGKAEVSLGESSSRLASGQVFEVPAGCAIEISNFGDNTLAAMRIVRKGHGQMGAPVQDRSVA